jgi:hypothetical protein
MAEAQTTIQEAPIEFPADTGGNGPGRVLGKIKLKDLQQGFAGILTPSTGFDLAPPEVAVVETLLNRIRTANAQLEGALLTILSSRGIDFTRGSWTLSADARSIIPGGGS